MKPPSLLQIFASLLCLAPLAVAQIPAFPGAEGFGAYATGGRGGDVYHVTNLNTSGAGSFADAIATVPAAGRTIVFDVSGHIHVNKTTLSKSKVTIAGQTAPGDGIGLRDGTFIISGDDIVIRHLRFRYGDKAAGGDCIDLSSGTLNAILDQVSIQFSTDENISSFSSPPENLTMQWALNGWGLESHSCGGLWDQNHATAHHTLWAHNHTRNPKARPNGLLEWINNVTFDWDIGFIMGDSNTPANWKANVRNSYFLAPAGNIRTKALEKANLDRNGNPNFSLYLNNCRHDSNGDGILNGTDKGYSIASGSYITLASPVANTGAIPVTMDDPTVAFKKIVSKAGALRLDVSYAGALRDEVDAKMVQNLVTQTRQHISTETALGLTNGGFGTLNSTTAPTDTDKDGMPDAYETALGWNPAVQDHSTALANAGGVITGTTFLPPNTPVGAGALEKYTRLEEYLHFLAIPHGTVAKNVSDSPTSIVVNMAKFTSGFAASPNFTVANVTGGSVALSGVGNSIATFTPALNTTGRARFDFTVTDGAGHAWTQTCALVVTTSGVPRDLKWMGGLNANAWDLMTNNWANGSTATAFSSGDSVRFDDSGSLSPAVNVLGTANTPSAVTVSAAGSYTFAGTGSLFSTGALTKRGAGSLTLSNSVNSFASVVLDEGTLSLPTGFTNAPAMVLNGGTLAFAASLDEPLAVSGSVAMNPSGTRESSGAWTGAGTANVTVAGTNTFTLRGDTSAFAGRVNLAGSTGFLRLYGSLGSPLATFDLGTSTADLTNRDGNATIDLGALAGGSGTWLGGASSVNAPTTYNIGANGNDTTFAGTIGNGGAGGVTNIVKLGGGTLTLTGTSTHTGTTSVNEGALAVNGSLASAVTVAGGAVLRGAGIFNGSVTTLAGAQVSPGAGSGQIGTLTAAGDFTATSTNFSMQLSSSPVGVNDKIRITGGTGQVNGTNNFDIAFANGVLGAGNYKLIECAAGIPLNIGGGMVMNLTTDAPAGSRQTFALNRTASGTAGGSIQLTVAGTPATLTWTGAASGLWDTTSANWTGAAPAMFFANDAVIFDDTAAIRTVTLEIGATGNPFPRAITVNTTLGYTFTGFGTLGGTGTLTKNGPGTLTMNADNYLSGGLALNAGTIQLASDFANFEGLGTGPVTLNGGVLSMHDDDSTYNDFTAALVVPAGATARINADARCDVQGTLSGAGILEFYVPWVRTTLFADWSAFTGTINVLSDAGGGDFRIGTSYSPAGYANATINLTANTSLYFTGINNSGAGTTIEIGELNGPSNAILRGGVTGGRALTYRIGGKTPFGASATFIGNIAEQNAGTTTNIVKTGAGKWIIHNGTWNGGTTVEQGILETTGVVTCASATNVAPGATLSLDEGDIVTDALNLAAGASLHSYGGSNVVGDLNNGGNLTVFGDELFVQGEFINTGSVELRPGAVLETSGDVVNNGTMRFQTGATLLATGAFVNNGLLDLLTSASDLPANFVNNGVVILNSDRRILSVAKTGASFSCTVQTHAGHVFQLQRADSLTSPAWVGVAGQSFAGNGTQHVFTDTAATGPQRFYRIEVTP